MKVRYLEYRKYKGSHVKVASHKKGKDGIWRENPKYEFHKMLVRNITMFPILEKKEYTKELN